MTALEVLYAAEASLDNSDIPYVFKHWTKCTVGHIYAASNNGEFTENSHAPQHSVDDAYLEALDAIQRAAGVRTDNLTTPYLISAVSDLTVIRLCHLHANDEIPPSSLRKAIDNDNEAREAALSLVRDGIKLLEAEYELARLTTLKENGVPVLV